MRLLIIISILLFSCSVEKRAQKKVSWLLSRDLMDDNCARLYPNRDSVVVRDSITRDTTYQDSAVYLRDTVYRDGDTIYREKKCPPVKIITNTIRKDSIIYRTNTAEVERLKGEILEKEKIIKEKDQLIVQKDKKAEKNDWWKWACLITWALIAIGITFKIAKKV